MRILGIMGSPRHSRNTGTLVEKILEGAESSGAETELYYINDYQIRPCQGCLACEDSGDCIEDDDMQMIYRSLKRMDGLVIGSPIYFDHISSQTKIFIDRLMCCVVPETLQSRLQGGVKAVLVFTWEAEALDQYDSVSVWLQGRLSSYLDIETIDDIKAGNTNVNVPAENKVLLQRAFDAGVKLVESLR